jgi:hypothetical protein
VQSQTSQPGDERVEKDLFPAAGKESTGAFSKAMLSQNKTSMVILFRKPEFILYIHVHIGKHV